MRTLLLTIAAAAVLFTTSTLFAHHSYSATYETTKSITLDGAERTIEVAPLLLLDGALSRPRFGQCLAARLIGGRRHFAFIATRGVFFAFDPGLLGRKAFRVPVGRVALARHNRHQQQQNCEGKSHGNRLSA